MTPATDHAAECARPPAQAQAQARVRRRVRKRDGPPQLQFVTATDPSQFKDETAKRSVRSQAMIQYRYRADQEKKGEPSEPSEQKPSQPRPDPLDPLDYIDSFGALVPPAVAGCATSTYNFPSRYKHALSLVPFESARHRVVDYEDSERHEQFKTRIMVTHLACFHGIGDGVDPFTALPQFKHPELSSIFLLRHCQRALVTPSTLAKWLPGLLAEPQLLLSSTALVSTWVDMMQGYQEDSKRTTLLKGEVIGWINERLRNSTTQVDDGTLMAITHILAGEMWTCNEKTVQIHIGGLARLIAQRGGLHCLSGAIRDVCTADVLHCSVFCEHAPPPLFLRWEPRPLSHVDDVVAIPESPVYCPRSEFYTVVRDARCSEPTYELLCDMRDLTDLFLANSRLSDGQSTSTSDYERQVGEIRGRLALLPSAHTPHLPTTHDWIYETCRIAALIYTSALLERVPFSVAAHPSSNLILADIASRTPPETPFPRTRLSDALFDAVERSNVSNDMWGDMMGVLYWATVVGAGAARTPVSVNPSHPLQLRSDVVAVSVRRRLIMYSTRVMVLLVFQHPQPVIITQRRLIEIQDMIGGSRPRLLPS